MKLSKNLRTIVLGIMMLMMALEASNVYATMGNPASTPCDGFMECIRTAYWWVFLR